jgi:uncharacterized protein (TIGR02145 family)
MKKYIETRLKFTIFLTLALTITACEKSPENDIITPLASFKITPETGLTTTIFSFDATSTTELSQKDAPVFIRWDWENDGIWDSPYSTKSVYNHRFLIPGRYSVLMETSNIQGYKDTLTIEVDIQQGYSAPKPAFRVLPDSANILAAFIFDASSTRDDEDSLENLTFRWDFEGDLIWDTEFTTNPVIEHQYSIPSVYYPRLQVADPSGLSDSTEIRIVANLLDKRIHAGFTYECGHCTVEDYIRFDASVSFHEEENESLLYSWDFRDDGIWEVVNSSNPKVESIIDREGENRVRLRTTDSKGMIMDWVDTLYLFGFNSPPLARIAISSHVGNPKSEIYMHSKASFDRDESLLDLKFRWDVDGDGQFEAEYNDMREIHVTYATKGKYGITLQVMDSGDKIDQVTDTIEIFEGMHETSYLIDKRGDFGGDLYGTVKIGNQWWMQENLKYSSTYIEPPIPLNYYKNDPDFYQKFGALYFTRDLIHVNGLCPNGWRVPKVKDFEILMDFLQEDITSKLIYGGESEFHLKIGGWIEFDNVSRGYPDMTHLWTADRDIQGHTPIGLFVNTKPTDVRFVYVNDRSAYYVRCIKE